MDDETIRNELLVGGLWAIAEALSRSQGGEEQSVSSGLIDISIGLDRVAKSIEFVAEEMRKKRTGE